MTKKLERIPAETAYKLCSGQVIIDLGTTIKELLENSLDAGSTSVEIKLKNYGLDSISVTDDGSGIDSDDFESLCRKNWTSKIEQFEDLTSVETFGFRGEALSSMCSVSDVSVITSTRNTEPMGAALEYDHIGEIKSKKPQARSHGTTVKLSNLFKGWPVRYQEFKRNLKRDFTKCIWYIEQYAIISDNVQISIFNQPPNGVMGLVLRIQRTNSLLERIGSIFGKQVKDKMYKVDENISSEVSSDEKFHIKGYISSPMPNSGRSSSDKQYIYLNGKPCEVPKIKKVINDVYKEFNPIQFPVAVISIKLQPNGIDFNVSPDKRSVFIKHDQELADFIYGTLRQTFVPTKAKIAVSQSTSVHSNISYSPNEKPNSLQSPDLIMGETNDSDFVNSNKRILESEKQQNPSISDIPLSKTNSGKDIENSKKSRVELMDCGIPNTQSTPNKKYIPSTPSTPSAPVSQLKLNFLQTPEKPRDPDLDLITRTSNLNTQLVKNTPERSIPKTPNTSEKPKALASSQVQNKESRVKISLKPGCACLNRTQTSNINITEVSKSMLFANKKYIKELTKSLESCALSRELSQGNYESLIASGISNLDIESAALALSRTISKNDFKEMTVLGQFNLGFIIAKHNDDLYIIDQHASDEKYNFENLRSKSVISSQPLIIPMSLELSIADENAAFEYKDILSKNGFIIKEDLDASPGYRVQLLSQPFVEKSLFTSSDLKDLLYNLRENPSESVRCARARNVFASRACRKSVMIGDPLSKNQMTSIVKNLSTLDHPWNCPHGRPTLRHLAKLAEVAGTEKADPVSGNKRPFTWSGSLFS